MVLTIKPTLCLIVLKNQISFFKCGGFGLVEFESLRYFLLFINLNCIKSIKNDQCTLKYTTVWKMMKETLQ